MSNSKRLLIIAVLSLFCFSCKTDREFYFHNTRKAIFKTNYRIVTIYNIPSGYASDDIRIHKGHNNTLIIPYKNSNIFYVSDDIYNSPNRQNIEQLHNVASQWRNNNRLLQAIKKEITLDRLKQGLIKGCNCTYMELFEYEMPEIVDLSGKEGVQIWRDVLVKDFCIGYIVYDSSMVEQLNKCIKTTLEKTLK